MEFSFTLLLILLVTILASAIFAFLGAKLGSQAALRNGNTYNQDGLDKRLQIHQKAFSLSLQLPSAAENPEKHGKKLTQG